MSEREGDKAGVENHRTYFKVGDGKMNLAPPAEHARWFHIQSVDLGNGANQFDREGDSVGVVTQWEFPDALEGYTDAHLQAIVAAVRAGTWRENNQANEWVGKAVGKAIGLQPGNPRDKVQLTGLIGELITRGILVVVERMDPERREMKKFVQAGALP